MIGSMLLAINYNGEAITQTAEAVTEAVTEAAAQAATVAETAAQPDGIMGMINSNPMIAMVIYVIVILAVMYFISIRPQSKREKAMKELQSAIAVGDTVMTSSGFYGKVVDICDQVFIVEFGTNKGIRIPVARYEVIEKKELDLKSTDSASIEKK